MPDFVLCRADQLIEGRGRPARAGDRYLAVFLVEGRIHVIDNQCLHVGSPIDTGAVVDGMVLCPWHGWAYDLETGAHVTSFGDREGLDVYPVWITEDGWVKVTVDGPVGD